MTRPRDADTHRRERPGGELGYDVADLDHLVANAIAVGPGGAQRALDAMPATALRAMVLELVTRRARVLLTEAGGDRVRAYDGLMKERKRCRGESKVNSEGPVSGPA